MECQSTPDGTICIRMFQYDVNIALQHAKPEQHILKIDFPHSAVIFLRDSSNISDKMTGELHTPDGTLSYDMVTYDKAVEEKYAKKSKKAQRLLQKKAEKMAEKRAELTFKNKLF